MALTSLCPDRSWSQATSTVAYEEGVSDRASEAAARLVIEYLTAVRRGDWDRVIPLDAQYREVSAENAGRPRPSGRNGRSDKKARVWADVRKSIRGLQTHGTRRGDKAGFRYSEREMVMIWAEPATAQKMVYTLARPGASFTIVSSEWHSEEEVFGGMAVRRSGMAWIRTSYADRTLAPLVESDGRERRLLSCEVGFPIMATVERRLRENGAMDLEIVADRFSSWGVFGPVPGMLVEGARFFEEEED